MTLIGSQHGITAAIDRLIKLDPKGSNPNRDPNDLSTWGAYDKLERTLEILAADHDAASQGGGSSPTPPPASRNPFEGLGAITAHDPQILGRSSIANRFRWVAIKGDGGDAGSSADAEALRRAGAQHIYLWYSWDTPHVLAPSDIGATAWIGQDEGEGQRAQAIDLA